MTQLSAAVPDVPAEAVVAVAQSEVDSFWHEFLPIFRHASSTMGPWELELAERAVLDLARAGRWLIWLAAGVAVSAASQVLDDIRGRRLSVMPFFGPECGREHFQRVLLERIEAYARSLGCVAIEIKYFREDNELDKLGYRPSVLELYTKDLRGRLS